MPSFSKKHVVALILVVIAAFGIHEYMAGREKSLLFSKIRGLVDRHYYKYRKKNTAVQIEDNKVSVEYSINQDLEDYVLGILKRYRSWKTAVVVLENDTGKILSAVGYDGHTRKVEDRLPFTSTHPGASLIKIVTAAAALESPNVDIKSKFKYRGKGSTLYRYQLQDKNTRWTRDITFERAFAHSNNVVFGKVAQRYLDSRKMFKAATRFGFNREIMSDINLTRSVFEKPEDNYNLAELATGFNRTTMISPVHAAVLSSIVANGGKLVPPRLVSKVYVDKEEQEVFERDTEVTQVISGEIAEDLKIIMKKAVLSGTARGGFRRMKSALRKNLEIGGKTGSLTGGFPHGKRDWISVFAKPVEGFVGGNGISVAIMIINDEKWHVRSSYLAKKVIEYYYTKIAPLRKAIDSAKLGSPDKRIVLRSE